MFIDIKNQTDNPVVRRIFSLSAFDKSEEGTEKRLKPFRENPDYRLYGWVENEKILGTCGCQVLPDKVIIRGIAVDENERKKGVGRSMISALREKYNKNIEAETDDGAVGFYQKCGFVATPFDRVFESGTVRRYTCVLYAQN